MDPKKQFYETIRFKKIEEALSNKARLEQEIRIAKNYLEHPEKNRLMSLYDSNIKIGRRKGSSYITQQEHEKYFALDLYRVLYNAQIKYLEEKIYDIDSYIHWVENAAPEELLHQIKNVDPSSPNEEIYDKFDESLFEDMYPKDKAVMNVADYIKSCIETKNFTALSEFFYKNQNKFQSDNLASATGNLNFWLKSDYNQDPEIKLSDIVIGNRENGKEDKSSKNISTTYVVVDTSKHTDKYSAFRRMIKFFIKDKKTTINNPWSITLKDNVYILTHSGSPVLSINNDDQIFNINYYQSHYCDAETHYPSTFSISLYEVLKILFDNKFTVDIYDIKQEVVFYALGFNPLIGTTVAGTNLNSIASILHKFNNLQNVKNNIVFAACFRRSTDTQSITNTKYDLILYDFRLSDIKVLTMFEAKEISELKLLVENYLTEYISNKGE